MQLIIDAVASGKVRRDAGFESGVQQWGVLNQHARTRGKRSN
jgi:hypothetical protein